MTLHDDAASTLPSDAELLAAVRAGDDEAYGVLYARHAGAALRVAKRMTIGTPLSAEDAVSQAFLNVLAAIRAGNGPGDSFRAYLYTVVRNEIMASRERESHVIAVDAPEDLETPTETPDPVVTAYESGVVGRAFSSLPERWQAVLWYHEVEGMKPGAIAPLLGLGANATSALLVRAREGLREAYLSAHVEAADRPECRWSAERMGPHVRGSLSRRDRRRFDAHLEDCADCRAMLAEVTEVARGLRVVVAPLVLGGGIAGWLIQQASAAPEPPVVAGGSSFPRVALLVGGGSVVATGMALVLGVLLGLGAEDAPPRSGSIPVETSSSDTSETEPEADDADQTSDADPTSDPASPVADPSPPATDPEVPPVRSQLPDDPPIDDPILVPTTPWTGDQDEIIGKVVVIDAMHSELEMPGTVQAADITWVSDQVLTRDIVVLDTPGGQFALAPDTVETIDMPDGTVRYVSTADATEMVQTIGAGTWTMAEDFPLVDWQLAVAFEGDQVSGMLLDGVVELAAGESLTADLGLQGNGMALVMVLSGSPPTAFVSDGTLYVFAVEPVSIRRIVVLLAG